jgi:hypothetical protein
VTTIEYVPLGVPVVLPPLLLSPPHPKQTPNRTRPTITSNLVLLFLPHNPIGISRVPSSNALASEPSPRPGCDDATVSSPTPSCALVRAIVVTETETLPGVPPLKLKEFGDTVQVDAAGAPVQVNCTLPENPVGADKFRLKFAGVPALTVAEDALAAIAKPVEPVPVSVIVCGLPAALSVIVSVPVESPEAVGTKVTLTVQDCPAPTEVPQVLLSEKGLVASMCATVRVIAPPFVIVTVWGALAVPTSWLEKERLVDDGVAPASPPWPVSLTVRGLPAELSVIVSVPVRVPATVGVNMTWMAHVPPAGATLVQLF